MSFQIDTGFVKQYHDVIERRLQQMGSRLRGAVRVESQQGEEQFWEQIGAVEAVEFTERHGDSPLMSTPHLRRRVTLRQYDVGDLIDKMDKVKMLIDPTSTYVMNFTDALSRKIDDTIISAFSGTAFTGKAGTTQTSFLAANQVAVSYGGADSNITVNKLLKAREILTAAEANMDEPLYVYCSASQISALLRSTQVTSSDYNNVRALVAGEVNTYLGFTFIRGQRGAIDGSNVRTVLAWAKSGVMAAFGQDITTEIAVRPDKRFSAYAYASLSVGATRMQEEKCVEIACDEDL